MSESPGPPSGADRLLRFVVRDAEWRDAVTGDLHEEFGTACRRQGVSRARRWYWRQALAIAGRMSVAKVMPGIRSRYAP